MGSSLGREATGELVPAAQEAGCDGRRTIVSKFGGIPAGQGVGPARGGVRGSQCIWGTWRSQALGPVLYTCCFCVSQNPHEVNINSLCFVEKESEAQRRNHQQGQEAVK